MDMWLLAAQLTMGGVTAPDLGWAPSEAMTNLPADLTNDRCTATLAQTSLTKVCATPAMAGIAARPMSAAAAGWPRPEQMMISPHTPSRRSDERLQPITGSQLYEFRAAALQAGELYPQAVAYRYINQWQRAFDTPTYDQWQALLAAEAAALAGRQGQWPLTVVVGDSLALWLPMNALPTDQLWLNQSISGETTARIRQRLHYFAATRPRTIHIMAGINDLKQGATETEVVDNLYQILTQLKQQHPEADLVMYAILPTRLSQLPSDRIQRVNRRLARLVPTQGATFVDLHPVFSDDLGQLRADLTTDGLHLNPQGYSLWQAALVSP